MNWILRLSFYSRLVLALSTLCLVRLYFSIRGGIQVDEAYYWVWSKHISWGYYDHPPMIAWLIALSRNIFDLLVPDLIWQNSPLVFEQVAFRWLPMFLAAVCAPVLLLKTVDRIQGTRPTLHQILFICSAPLFLLGPQMVTPDIPFFFFWTLSMWLCHEIRSENSTNTSSKFFSSIDKKSFSLGVVLGAAGLSKFTAILALPMILVSGLSLRSLLWIVSGGLLSISPFLIWQFGSASASDSGIYFQFGRAWATHQPKWRYVGDLFASQLFFWSPMVLLGLFGLVFSPKKLRAQLWFAAWALLPLFFFLYASYKKPSEGNWPWVGVLGALVVLSVVFSQSKRIMTAFLTNHIFITVLAVLLIADSHWLAPYVEPFSSKAAAFLRGPSRMHEFQGWTELHSGISEATKGDQLEIHIESYQYLSEMILFDSAVPDSQKLGERLKIWPGSRVSQFNKIPQYLPSGNSGHYPHWLVAIGYPSDPAPCPVHAVVVKPPRQIPYRIMKCF